jgi:hypothetical protein
MEMKHVKGVVNDAFDANLQGFKREAETAAVRKANYLAKRDRAYRTSGLFRETVVSEDCDQITRLRT